jgi:lipopolysaccharide transport system ATP-binding protein
MSDIAIRVENLGKRYRIGKRERYQTLRDTLTDTVTAPFRWLRHGKSANGNGGSDHIWALKDLSFEIPRGEVVGVIGRNGAGKSTLLKVLSRITEPTEGQAEIHGRVASLLEVGTGFHPELTGRENIYLNSAILGMRKAEIARKFDEIVAFAEIERFLDTPVKHYSSGMYMRLAFAVAAHLEPEILVVDEVLAVGDAQFQRKCLGKMGDVARQGRTVLLVSHNMAAISSLSERCLWIERGHIVEGGPSNSVVQRFLATMIPASSHGLDLVDCPRAGDLDSGVRIVTFKWLQETIMHNERAEFEIGVQVDNFADGVSVGIGLSSVEGARLLTYETDFQNERVSLEPGKHIFRLRIEKLPLGPGLYGIDVGARSGDEHCLDYLASFGRVAVVPGTSTPSQIIRDGSGVRLPCLWDHEGPLRPLAADRAESPLPLFSYYEGREEGCRLAP